MLVQVIVTAGAVSGVQVIEKQDQGNEDAGRGDPGAPPGDAVLTP